MAGRRAATDTARLLELPTDRTVDDLERLFHEIPLDRVSTSMTINATASILLALYLGVAEKQGVPWDKVNGTIQNDVLKEYIARGTYIYPPGPSLRIISDTFAYCAEHLPSFNTISISGYHMGEAGATPVQEVAFTLADGIAYVEAAIEAGLAVDVFAQQVSNLGGFSQGTVSFASRGPGPLPSEPFVANDGLVATGVRDVIQTAIAFGLRFDVGGGVVAQVVAARGNVRVTHPRFRLWAEELVASRLLVYETLSRLHARRPQSLRRGARVVREHGHRLPAALGQRARQQDRLIVWPGEDRGVVQPGCPLDPIAPGSGLGRVQTASSAARPHADLE